MNRMADQSRGTSSHRLFWWLAMLTGMFCLAAAIASRDSPGDLLLLSVAASSLIMTGASEAVHTHRTLKWSFRVAGYSSMGLLIILLVVSYTTLPAPGVLLAKVVILVGACVSLGLALPWFFAISGFRRQSQSGSERRSGAWRLDWSQVLGQVLISLLIFVLLVYLTLFV